MKFGGASVAAPERFNQLAQLIQQRRQEAARLVIVVSAMHGATSSLADLAYRVNPSPPQREYDMLVSVGERISISLLAMALARLNCHAVSFTGSQSGIITCPNHADATIVDVRPKRLVATLDKGQIAIVAGFQGVSLQGEITTLGRGGSDTTAVALGVALGAECVEFYKDVPGVFSEDPKLRPDAQWLPQLSYQEAQDIVDRGAGVLHPRCIGLAARNDLPLIVRSFQPDEPRMTVVGPGSRCRSKPPVYEPVGAIP